MTKTMKVAAGFAGTTWIVAVLDESGSMGPLRNDTIGGFNAWLAELQGADGAERSKLTVLTFSARSGCEDVRRVRQGSKRLPAWKPLRERDYLPGGNTPLLDAVAAGIDTLERRMAEGDRALALVITDGLENASREMTLPMLRRRIKRLEESGSWTFVFLGAGPEAFAQGHAFGIAQSFRSQPTGVGTQAIYSNLSTATARYMSSAGGQSVAFLSPDEQDKIEKPEQEPPHDA